MNEAEKALECLRCEIEGKEKGTVLSFKEFLELAKSDPQRVLRNIFQLFYDMVKTHVGEGIDEYPDDPESIGFVKYDCSKIFAVGKDNPFFPDRLLANRFIRQVENLKQGSQQNRIYAFIGPPGCGKSTFLNNLLQTFEGYTNTREGQSFEILWQIKTESGEIIEVPCPSHDHPILIFPKDHRVNFLNELLSGKNNDEIRHRFAEEKEYEWLFEGEVCTICQSIFSELCKSEKYGSFDKVLETIKVRPYQFNRRLGEGISVFNPGDKPSKETYLGDKQIQEKLDKIFGVNRVKYVFSQLARTNNGIYVLMDIKDSNEGRLFDLHNVATEGVHKVNGTEERINSFLFALMNPGDKEKIEEKKWESLQARIQENKISYVMEAPTEVQIYRSIFGKNIDSYFLPRVLENFARVIISSRMKHEFKSPETDPLQGWIPDMRQYSEKHYCDEKGLLLRMEIYGGIIPTWLSEEDRKKFTAPIRRELIAFGEKEGDEGIDGRKSISLFGNFLNFYGPKPSESKSSLINMANVVDFFERKIIDKKTSKNILPKFINSLVDWYDYVVLSEVKEALYFYNKKQIQEDILNYLCAINYDPDGRKIECEYTHKDIEVTVEFLHLVGSRITGESMDDRKALRLAHDIQKKFIEMIAREPGKSITETELYQELFGSYARNLKEKVLEPFLNNESFREAIKSFGNKEFETFDTRLKNHVAYMIENLKKNFGYTEQGAKEICFYVLDQGLAKKFS